MHLKCAADMASVFVGSVFAVRAPKSPAMLTTGSSANAVISAVISTEACSVEVTHRQPRLNNMCHIFQEVGTSHFEIHPFSRVLLSQGTAGVPAGCVYVTQHFVAERVSALSARSLVFLRMNRFVRAEGTVAVAPVPAMTTASKAQLVSFALPAPASAPCTGTVIFLVLENFENFKWSVEVFKYLLDT